MATRNEGKLREVRAILEGLDVSLESLDAYENVPDVVEDGHSFFENALKKAKVISEYTGEIALADDSGLEVDALNGQPGIYSARFAGPEADDDQNIEKLLDLLKDSPPDKRMAAFRCVLVLYYPDGTHESFEGNWKGFISETRQGSNGFGYDPVFLLPEYDKTVAQLTAAEKNQNSHRAKALQALKESLRKKSYKIK
ncbi:XTP/dITP diphosphohydrolase [Syntrophus gentianae]|uniref:dITP/XTP pyrophosphatase n=1 Tax=Syntrophus gentianae TaxID=43775 RepID=A0A1H7ZSD5_9BACT|nr:XTP/dITP diphosphatase [Syntrophus gentianae]SEM61176.1 XTP/dITP diphosphohydrolase [Syntrophus gentianae]